MWSISDMYNLPERINEEEMFPNQTEKLSGHGFSALRHFWSNENRKRYLVNFY